MNKTFLIVFHGKREKGKIVDIGNDPCFDNIPSWGICRPTTRRAVKVGDTLIFIANIGKKYFLKGWFQVGDKLDYISALQQFPNRENVIISKTQSRKDIVWSNGKLRKRFKAKNNHTTPTFLSDLKTTCGTFYQSQADNHQIDNWKCRRIFGCQFKQFESCIEANSCLKSGASLDDKKYKNYIVAKKNLWEDLDYLGITFKQIVKATKFPTQFKTPLGQHNVLRFDKYKQKLFTFIEIRKKKQPCLQRQKHRAEKCNLTNNIANKSHNVVSGKCT